MSSPKLYRVLLLIFYQSCCQKSQNSFRLWPIADQTNVQVNQRHLAVDCISIKSNNKNHRAKSEIMNLIIHSILNKVNIYSLIQWPLSFYLSNKMNATYQTQRMPLAFNSANWTISSKSFRPSKLKAE